MSGFTPGWYQTPSLGPTTFQYFETPTRVISQGYFDGANQIFQWGPREFPDGQAATWSPDLKSLGGADANDWWDNPDTKEKEKGAGGAAAPIASGATPQPQPVFVGNKCMGRVVAGQCSHEPTEAERAGTNESAFGLTPEQEDAYIAEGLREGRSIESIALSLAAKRTAFEFWNIISLGQVSRQDELVIARNRGEIDDSQYWRSTAVSAGTRIVVAASGGSGAVIGGLGRLGTVGGAAAGGFLGDAAIQGADVGVNEITDGRAGQESFSVRQSAISTATAGALGRIFGSPTANKSVREAYNDIREAVARRMSKQPHPTAEPPTQTPDSPGEGAVVDKAPEPEVCRNGKNCTLDGEPVDVVTGEVVTEAEDFRLFADLPLTLQRGYRSAAVCDGLLGPKWSSNWGQYVAVGADRLTVHAADGFPLSFPMLAPGATVRHALQRKIELTALPTGYLLRDESRRLLEFSQPLPDGDGRRWALARVTDPNGNSIAFEYEGGELRRVRHSGGYSLLVETDAGRLRRVSLESDPLVDLVRFDYSPEGMLSAVYNGSGKPFRFSYDQAGRLLRWDDRCGTWYAYRYDEAGRCIEGHGSEGVFQNRFEYHPERSLTVFIDSFGHRTQYHYNAQELVERTVYPDGTEARSTWDALGRRVADTDALGATTHFRFDAFGNLLGITDPLGRQTRVEYGRHHLPVQLIDAAGTVWRRSYDERGNLLSTGLLGGPETRLERDGAGRMTAYVDASGRRSEYSYDARGLTAAMRSPSGTVARFEHDERGRTSYAVDGLGNVTRYGHHAIGKVAQIVAPDGAQQTWDYDAEGNLVQYRDGRGQRWRYQYGAFDRLAQVEDPLGCVTRYQYDAEGRILAVVNPLGLRYRYAYDACGRRVSETDFNGHEVQYRYDAAGRQNRRTNALGQSVEYEYDSAGQMVSKTTAERERVEFIYDPLGRLIRAYDSAEDSSVRGIVFERDAHGRVVAEVQDGRRLVLDLDADGRRLASRTSSGHEIRWQLDANGMPVGLELPGVQTLSMQRDALGRETARGCEGGWKLLTHYDRCGRVTAQRMFGKLGLRDSQYGYDEAGNLTRSHDAVDGLLELALDPVGRITSVQRAHRSEHYAYDAAGNIASSARSGPLSDSNGPRSYEGLQVTQAGDTRFRYDAAGRLVERIEGRRWRGGTRRWRYEWNSEDRLVAVEQPDGSRWTYRYDAVGRRLSKNGPGVQHAYLWDQFAVVEEFREGGGARTDNWDYLPGSFIPLCKTERRDSARSWFAVFTDRVGAPTALLTADGRVAWSAQRTAWGDDHPFLPDHEPDVDCDLSFPGQWRDGESGLSYNCQRYYCPETGRYVSADPIGLSGGPNPYAYVDNPTGWSDPLGLAPLQGVDFTGSPDLFPVTGTQRNIVTITMQGSRGRDFTQAYAEAGIPRSQAANYTWHHVNDFDPVTGRTTMQLVKQSAHEATYPHAGSVKQFQDHFGVEYDTPEAIKIAEEKQWLKGRAPKCKG